MYSIKLASRFISYLFKDCKGYIELRAIARDKTRAFSYFIKPQQALPEQWLKQMSERKMHICFGVATRKQRKGTKENCFYLPALWADLDKNDIVLNGVPEPTLIINSGKGKHLYWLLEKPIRLEPDWKISSIEAILEGIAQKVGADTNPKDISRVLRLPGSFNPKYDPQIPVTLHSYSGKTYHIRTFTQFKTRKKTTYLPPAPWQPGDTNGLETMIDNCMFIQWCRDNQEAVKEPLWYAMISNLVAFEGGEYYAHLFSCRHPKYTEKETNYKIKRAKTKTRPHTCEYIQKNGFNCAGCPWYGEVRSPAGIPYKVRKKVFP
ncbi:MAG TPA: hypothetical protein ENF38_01390 [Candidatus Aenigmarchaeota archaeon]|nr:hypothetical protein [Candidatus Aenigmarchaeota archaeon]